MPAVKKVAANKPIAARPSTVEPVRRSPRFLPKIKDHRGNAVAPVIGALIYLIDGGPYLRAVPSVVRATIMVAHMASRSPSPRNEASTLL